MKKLFLLAGLAIAMMASAQVLNVTSVEQLRIPAGDVKVAGIGQDGSYVLLTTSSNVGLKKYELATGATEVISEATGAGYNVEVAADGAILYREKSIAADRTVQTALMKRTLTAPRAEVLQAPTRSTRDLAVAAKLQTLRPVLSIENRQLMLTMGARTTTLSPCGTDQSYIWPSVSPDGKKVLFYVCGRGAYVCDLNGKNLVFLGHDLRAPKWYNNEVVIGMNDQDNGEVTISSEIVAVDLKGHRQVLTTNGMYPYATSGKIVCSGLQGETYVITVE